MSNMRRRLNLLNLGDMEKKIRLICDYTVEADMSGNILDIDKDSEGKSIDLEEVFVKVTCKGPSEHENVSGGYDALLVKVNGSAHGLFYGEVAISTLPADNAKQIEFSGNARYLSDGFAVCTKYQSAYGGFNESATKSGTQVDRIYQCIWGSVASIQVSTSQADKYVGPGTRIQIWGR